jgi:hypothetical protein
MKARYRSLRDIIILTVLLTLAACSNLSNPVRADYPEDPETPENPEEPEPIVPGLPMVKVMTVDKEAPTCEFVSAPEGCMGQSIRNATKVGGRMTITQNGQTLYDSGDYVEELSGMTIRIRGNSSAWKDKRAYKIKLQQAADLLERGDDQTFADKEWLLINDETRQLNTMVGLKVNELLNLQWTPRFRFVNLTLNGDFQGLYLLIESVKRKTSRLNVSKSGYIVEFDPYWWNEDVWFETLMTASKDAKFTFKYPDTKDILPERIDSIRNYINAFDDGLVNKNQFAEYIDSTSFAAWMLAQDILGNYDAHGSNIFITKYDDTKDSKLMMGCLWDFDAIMLTPDEWSNSRHLPYFARLISNGTDRSVANAYYQLWEEVKDTLFIAIKDYLEAFVASEEGQFFDEAIATDNKRWGRRFPTLRQLANDAEAWFDSRKLWLETAIEGNK